ncbi:MAG: hypothetical protein EBZ44_01395, partial [Verrucomicrobia bacterium]|nr:hypothetical protein [Verrucomicrobiota bacterium]
MKKLFFLAWMAIGSGGWAEQAQLAGLWKNTAVGIGQSAIIISQEGATIHVAGYGVCYSFCWRYFALGLVCDG